jgi:hypothetical protein
MDQIGCLPRQSVVLAIRPAVFDRYMLSLDNAAPVSAAKAIL